MKSYIKLLSAALLVAGAATQVNASSSTEDQMFKSVRTAGHTSEKLSATQVGEILSLGGPVKSSVRDAFKSKFKAWEEANPIAGGGGHTALALGGYSEAHTLLMKAHGHTDPAIILIGELDNTANFTKLRSTAIDFSSKLAADQTVLDYQPSVAALSAVTAFTSLKKGNQLYLVKAISELLAQKDDVTTAIAEAVQKTALTKFTGSAAVITEADSKASVGKVLAGLVKGIYDAEVTGLATTNANLDKNALVTTELEKDATWTAILAALK